MIPLKLQLRNFMSYRDDVPPLVFEGFRLACLSGENGHGKSALLDAITWALWGKARSKSEDELIHFGKTEMEVEYEFELNEQRYRVLRKRALRKAGSGVRGSGALDLQISGELGYRSIAGNTMSETQRKLNELLRMDYETFVNSAFILQGKADAFTVKTPSERKQVLAELLGLSVYDELEAAARERGREAENQRREREAARATVEAEAARLPEYEEQALELEAQLERLADGYQRAERERDELREQRRDLEQLAPQQQDLQQRRQRVEADLAENVAQVERQQAQLSRIEQMLAGAEQVEAGYERLQQLRRRQEEQAECLRQLLSLGEEAKAAERQVDEERNRLRTQQQVAAVAARDLRQRAAVAADAERELTTLAGQLVALDEAQAESRGLRERQIAIRHQLESLRGQSEQVLAEGKLRREKIDMLHGEGARCPLCESELGEAGLKRLRGRLSEEREALLGQYQANEGERKRLEGESADAERRLALLERDLQQQRPLQDRSARLQKSVADAAEAAASAQEREAEARRLSEELAAERFAPAAREALRRTQARIEALAYDAGQHARIRSQLTEHQHYEQLRQQLHTAAAQRQHLSEQLENAQALQARWRDDLTALQARLAELGSRLVALPGLRSQVAEAERLTDGLARQHNLERQRYDRVLQSVDTCKRMAQQSADLGRQINSLAEDKAIYDELAHAFGKKGIQAMLIEAAVPELEEEANRLLRELSEGRMTLRLETQRAAKSSDNLIETLDIRIADELGTRSYETFSGGEAFKINFALRVALSKLLARRAGARLELLVIDEGFGTQDSLGRQRLVEAISTVSKDFQKILVITHIEELKDAFPVRIEVTKTADEGSVFTIT